MITDHSDQQSARTRSISTKPRIRPSEPKPDPRAQTPPVHKSGEVSQDQVTLKSAGQPDTDRR